MTDSTLYDPETVESKYDIAFTLDDLKVDTHDQFSLMRAMRVADHLIRDIMRIREDHAENLCRMVNRLEAAYTDKNGMYLDRRAYRREPVQFIEAHSEQTGMGERFIGPVNVYACGCRYTPSDELVTLCGEHIGSHPVS